jgi:hypothetical protein
VGRLYPKLDWAPQWLRAKYTFQELALDSAGGFYRMVCRVHDTARARLYSRDMLRAVSGIILPITLPRQCAIPAPRQHFGCAICRHQNLSRRRHPHQS